MVKVYGDFLVAYILDMSKETVSVGILNGTIGRSSDLSYFASFPIGLPPISGLFAKDTSVVSCFKFQVSGFKF